MNDAVSPRSIRYIGPPRVSSQGREVFSFHLQRYLSGWLGETGCARVMVTIGFPASDAELGAYRISPGEVQPVRTGWTHRDLEDAWRFGNGRLVWEGPDGDSVAFEVVPLFDAQAGDQDEETSALLGFVTVREAENLNPQDYETLAQSAAEAICVARRNGVRLFFDEQRDLPVKSLLYETMHRLPEWAGCDHSAAVLVTHDLDAMTLEDATHGQFNVLAERIFLSDGDADQLDRLVGMTVSANDEEATLLSDALRRYSQQPEQTYFRYHLEDGEQAIWVHQNSDAGLLGWHGISDRPAESTIILVPLVHRSHQERDLLGFLALSWKAKTPLAPSIDDVLSELRTSLARLMRHSPLYTLSVRKMWVVRRVRDCIESALVTGEDGQQSVEALIGSVSELVANHVDVPSFAMGYLIGSEGERALRYVHPHGWTRFDDLDLDVDVAPKARVDSGISALAVRLRRPVVLAGGHGEGESQAFKNHLWVDEEARKLFDARSVGRSLEGLRQRGRPLREYYKPARETAYATLAYPMIFSERLFGVLTVEVEKTTDWLWWTGFGGHLFWDMIAREMAMGLALLDDK